MLKSQKAALYIAQGALKGRKIIHDLRHTSVLRPTTGRLRLAVMNYLRHRFPVPPQNAWDLCAGTGAYGLEALSWGVGTVHFVEAQKKFCDAIAQTLQMWNIDETSWVMHNLHIPQQFIPQAYPLTGVIFCDPPYAYDIQDFLNPFHSLVQNDTCCVVETDQYLDANQWRMWHIERTLRQGHYAYILRKKHTVNV